MSAPTTMSVADFIDVIRKSGVLEATELDGYLSRRSADSVSLSNAATLADAMIRDGLLTRFQAKLLLQGKWRNFILDGKYKVLDLLGTGGMGNVYLCEHTRMRRRVAVKVLPTDKETSKVARERFLREARAAATLNHPNIVRAHDIETDAAMPYLVMEYVEGISLQELITKQGPLDPIRAAHCVSQTALGLQHAFEAGLVHRDIKPGNILLDAKGVVKILDLGLARFAADRNDQLTRQHDSGAVLGTADFVAPEQAVSSDVDIRADIYSLGATFYFLLAGKPPFAEGTLAQKLIWHQMKQPTPIHQVRTEVPPEMSAVLHAMMAKNPAERYQQPIDVVRALAPWTSAPTAPPPQEVVSRQRPGSSVWESIDLEQNSGFVTAPRSSKQRLPAVLTPAGPSTHRYWLLAVVGILLLGGAVAGYVVWQNNRPTASKSDTENDETEPTRKKPIRPGDKSRSQANAPTLSG